MLEQPAHIRRVTLRLEQANFRTTPRHGLRASCRFSLASQIPDNMEGWNGQQTLHGDTARCLLEGQPGSLFSASVEVIERPGRTPQIYVNALRTI